MHQHKNLSMNKKNKISPKDIYNSLWRCRDFELAHLWQRSVFLTAFLVVCFTGYGAILINLSAIADNEMMLKSFLMLSLSAIVLSVIGIFLSTFWIMMAKGSKSWYEKYERALYKIERNKKYCKSSVSKMDEDKVIHGSLPTPDLLDDRLLFNTNGGRYSVSRINIAIGQLSLVVWTIIYLTHSILFSFSQRVLHFIEAKSWVGFVLLFVFILLFFIIQILLSCKKWLSSSGI